MCGIAGIYQFKNANKSELKETVKKMNQSQAWRGPDDEGIFIDEKNGVALGHRRLSILDLSTAGKQPMEFGRYVITYNGEVYNFQEIREELKRLGYDFYSQSDTEVILKSFDKWGIKAVSRFRGMWAFAIWDKLDKKLILCRDRIGVKPLYYYYSNDLFLFASGIKAFHQHQKFKQEKKMDKTGLSLFFSYGYIPAPYSIFKDVFKLEPGYLLIVNEKGELEKKQYWNLEDYFLKGFYEQPFSKKSELEIIEELETILTESFKLRMIADVPVGIFLSGGIDSSLVTTLLQKNYSKALKTFTIGFKEFEYDESKYAKNIADYLGTDHTQIYCTYKEAADIIPRLTDIYDEPFGDSSAIPTILVSKLAREKVKVSLSADGGDEQFCGYPKYWNFSKIEKLNFLPFRRALAVIMDLVNPDIVVKYLRFLEKVNFKNKYRKLKELLKARSFVDKYELVNRQIVDNKLFKNKNDFNNKTFAFKFKNWKLDNLDSFLKMMFIDLNTYLVDDILVKVDRATMSVGLEGRDPLLDNKIIEYASQLPYNFKYRNKTSKYILRKILSKHLPQNLIDRPKMGFGVPVEKWFKSELKHYYLQYLDRKIIEKEDIFNPIEVEKLLKNYLNGNPINHNKLWFLFIFQQWKEKWLK